MATWHPNQATGRVSRWHINQIVTDLTPPQLPAGWTPNAPIADLHGTVHAVLNDVEFIKEFIQTRSQIGPTRSEQTCARRGRQVGQPRKQRLGTVDVSISRGRNKVACADLLQGGVHEAYNMAFGLAHRSTAKNLAACQVDDPDPQVPLPPMLGDPLPALKPNFLLWFNHLYNQYICDRVDKVMLEQVCTPTSGEVNNNKVP